MSIGSAKTVDDSTTAQTNGKPCNGVTSPVKKRIRDDIDIKIRLRRTKSVTQVEQITAIETKTRRSQHDKPCHKTRDSLFSWSSGFDRFGGFVNWGALLLIIGGTRLFLENVLKYGIRVSPHTWFQWITREQQNYSYIHTSTFLIISQFHLLFAYYLEKLMSQNRLSGSSGVKIHIVHLLVIIFSPVVLMFFWPHKFSLIGRTVICCFNIIVFVKLWSYVQVNHWCRQERDKTKKYLRRRSYSFKKLVHDDDETVAIEKLMNDSSNTYNPVEYPDNITLKDFYYFLVAPTLCYELNFPRSHGIRIRFLLRRVVEVFILSNILLGLFQQWIIPSVINSFKPFSEMNYMKCTERILKLAIPNHLLWLIWFYLFFHSFLNTVGELIKFGDRNFYQAWWNAKDVGTFWKTWNMPVHRWCVRHLYIPVLKSTRSRATAAIAVFLLSAFFHEYLVSVPLGMYKIGVFLGMFMQVPLGYISEVIANNLSERLGNVIVWTSLIIGQPIAIMIYYHDYIIENWDPTSYAEYFNSTSVW